MSLRNLVEDYLIQEPKFRERTAKDRGIVNLLVNRYGLHYAIERGEITKDRIIALVQDYATMDRAWRKTLQERSDLRGTDYDEKDDLEAEVCEQLGYPSAGEGLRRLIESDDAREKIKS